MLGQQQRRAGLGLLGGVIQGLSTELPVQPQLLTPREGALTALGGRSGSLGCPHHQHWTVLLTRLPSRAPRSFCFWARYP